MSRIQRIELPDGTVVLARLSSAGDYGSDDQDVGVLDGAVARVERLGELIGAVGTSVLSAARAVRPDEAAVTFGVELAAKSGKALAVLAEGEAKASIQVTLTWHAAGQPPLGAAPATPGAEQAPGVPGPVPGEPPAATPAPRSPTDGAPSAPDDSPPGSAPHA